MWKLHEEGMAVGVGVVSSSRLCCVDELNRLVTRLALGDFWQEEKFAGDAELL